jgi:hypothetical protein
MTLCVPRCTYFPLLPLLIEPIRNISYATQTVEGTQAWDTFMSLVATTRQLGISFFEYIRDRISQVGNIPSLASIIREKSALNSFGLSWMPE